MSVPEAFFVPDGDDRFVATEHSRGPWSRDHQHAGPPSALLARAIERAVAGEPVTVTRLTVELFAPVPIGRLEIATTTLRAGRTVRRLEATLADGGRALARASALVTRTTVVDFPAVKPEPHDPLPPPESGEPFRFPVFEMPAIGYQSSVDARLVRGGFGQNPTSVWIRARVPLVLGEAISPLQRVMIAADSGNGVAVVLDPARYTFINADLTVYLHRPLAGEWVGLDTVTLPEPSGIGASHSRLWDLDGPIGWALQSLVVEARRAGR
ncbi:MAG TPA: thioesterase family protein [Methylomirabilota bacterium]|nr:thioesterase family protein [Methylomirabilota bacterium]